MNRRCAIVFLAIAVAVVVGCRREVISAGTDDKLVSAVGPKTITVGTADELVSAIGPNRTIKLRPGVYDLSSVMQRQMEFVLWTKVYDGYELVVRNVSGLKLIGAGKAPQLLAKPRYANVLTFDGCKDVALENLILGHTPEGYCEGGVMRMNKCSDVMIDKCDLFGCGIEGLTLSEVTGLKFGHSTIRDCTYGIMTVSKSRDIVLSDSSFIRNKEFGGFSFSDSRNIRLERCVIKANRFDALDAELFSAVSCSDIIVSGCTITGNVYKSIMAPTGSVKIIVTEIEGNSMPPEDDR